MLLGVCEGDTSCDVCTFVVSTEKEKVFWPADFEGEEETYCFETLTTSIDIVS